MTPLEFLRTVWPDEGYYCLAFPREAGGFDHSVFETIEEAATHTENVKGRKNVYFATHSLEKVRVWNKECYRDRETKEWRAGWSVRVQTNMLLGRDFFFDLDVGTGKDKYANQYEALVALKQFVKDCKLPKPMVVSSGYGLHGHWIITEALDSNSEWKTHATRLRQLAFHYKLKVDPKRTTDTSSVLRVPETFNLKQGMKLRVECLSRPEIVTPKVWADALKAALDDVELEPSPELLPDDEMGSNVKKEYIGTGTPPSTETVFEVCGQLRRIRDLDGALREPEWYGAMGALQFAENGREVCHQISRGHPAYTKGYVDNKIDQWHYGPTSCSKLALDSGQSNADICAKCPWVEKNSGPISIARLEEKAPPPVVMEMVDGKEIVREILNPPPPYKRAKNGSIEVLIEGKTGKTYTETIYSYDLYPLDRVTNEDAETEAQVWRVHLPHAKVKDFSIPASVFVDERALKIRLANVGIYSTNFDKLRAYMSFYIQHLQRQSAAQVQYGHLGWVEDFTEFVLPQGIIRPTGAIEPVSLAQPALSAKEFIRKKGNLSNQIELLKFYNDPKYVANQFFICASLASILFHITGHYGVIVHAFGPSGASKSSSMFAAASFWGRPQDYVIDGRDDGSTLNYRATRTHMLSNLPVMIDEITLIAHDMAKSMALGVSQKPDKGRLNSDASIKKGISADKSSIMMTTANVSFYSLLAHANNAGSAAAVRVFELLFEKDLDVHKSWQVNTFLRELKENYGHIGEVFTRFVLKNLDRVKARVIQVQEDLERIGHMQADERFWFSLVAAVLVSLDLANKLELLSYDHAHMRQWLLTNQLPRLRGVVKDEMSSTSPLTLLTDYIAEKHGDICIVDSSTENNIHLPNNRLLGHYDLHTRELVLLKAGFRQWCSSRNQYSQPLLRDLLRDGVIDMFDVQRTLGAGTNLAKGQSLCFTVDMSHSGIAAVKAEEKLLPPNVVPMRKKK